MLNNEETHTSSLRFVCWLISSVAFAIGFWQTATGLSAYNVFGHEYGRFIFSGLISALIVVTYQFAVKGRSSMLVAFLFLASINFIYNFNSMYSSSMSDGLLREDLISRRNELSLLIENAKTAFENDQRAKIQNVAMEKVRALQAEIAEGGLHKQALKLIEELEVFIEMKPGELPRLNAEHSDKYYDLVKKHLESHRFMLVPLSKEYNIIHGAEDRQRALFDTIDKLLANNVLTLQEVSSTIQESAKLYSDVCIKSKELSKELSSEVSCDKSHLPIASDLGKVTHTFSLAKQRLDEFNTWTTIGMCLAVDFITPLIMYLALKPKPCNSNMSRWDRLLGRRDPNKAKIQGPSRW